MPSIEDICREWITEVANDMKAEIHSLVTHSGGQESDLEGSVSPSVTVLDNGNIVVALSMNDYWQFFEKGRKAGKMPPTKPIEDWVRKKGLKFELTVKKNPTKKRKGITKAQRTLSADRKIKGIAFVIARSIGKKGIKPRPFFDKVFNQSRIEQLKQRLAPVFKNEFIIELKK